VAELRLFASAREAVGSGRVPIPPDVTTVQAVLDWAAARWAPALAPVLATSRIWVNGEPVDLEAGEVPLGPDDEVAVLPPVSGGVGN
jgi:molybdopterin synthase sulfur carrier subunit